MLELRDVSYSIDNRRILDGINMSIEKGEAIAVVGPSGSGKSTLLRVIADLISPTEGEISYKGHLYQEYSPEKLRQRISYLPQSVELFGDTVEDNLAFPARTRGEDFNSKRAKQLLKQMGLNKYKLSDYIQYMSGGEQQRITIARQLMYIPEVLLLDEATSALDAKNSDAIEDLIFEMAQNGTTVLWITHNQNQSKSRFNRKIIIKNGQVDEEVRLS
ncbi:ABC transporter ATP-binding protein [Staphylococcus canis]|uniref:ATP-binding cassette domain-containing protein n=1 Tax=Staphylococcus canis TaxID=2724942 RepID=A0ABS0TB52_9STAP|nr:ATP-binding cassette domain-containing protein [Staphylococcus canis]MBI5975962.1 ATP-binding cassette domain-containing protein [Staphylococcus canis]